MKLSISLPAKDVELLDEYARKSGLTSRSAAVHQAVRLLGQPDLEDDYEAAWTEWESSGGQSEWDAVVSDGLADATR